MFDWASFIGGAAGSAIGGGVTLLVHRWTRSDTRDERLKESVAQLTTAVLDIERAGLQLGEKGPHGKPLEDFRERESQFTVAMSSFSARLKKREERVGTWVAEAMGLVLMYPPRVGAVGLGGAMVAGRLAAWLSGTTKTRYFKRVTPAQEFESEYEKVKAEWPENLPGPRPQ